MNKPLIQSTIFLVILAFILIGCEFSASTANIDSAVLSANEDNVEATTTFNQDDTFYAVVQLANAPDDTEVKAVWIAVDVGDAAPADQLIDEVSIAASSGEVVFDLANDGPWPAGQYKVDLFLDGEPDRTLEFTVQSSLSQSPSADEPADEPAAEPEADSAPAEDAPSSGGAVSQLEEVESATIRIMSQGSFIDPDFGSQVNAAGQGSGFIIDPAGIAVTNNHVVTGAAFLQVWLEGDQEPRNAKLLGVSECSDLAVIDIDGEGYPYLEWYEGDLDVGQEIYVAGFPLFGNEEYTLTRGIIKAQAAGETNWASVDKVLEVDAVINGGNSGGPLVDGEGHVVGVNYAARDDTRQGFSISRDEAVGVIEQLQQGTDLHSIGVNGRAVMSEDGSIFGIWVSSVASGTPADQVGLQAGDIITTMEGLVLGTDGTMADYCDILRGRDAGDVMSIEALRLSTGEVLSGQLNGDALETSAMIDLGGDVASGDSYDSYSIITNDSESLEVEVPTVWADVQSIDWTSDDVVLGPGLLAAPNTEDYFNTWTTPGMFFGASSDGALRNDPMGLLDSFDLSESCAYDGRSDYEDSVYSGAYDVWSNCGGEGSLFVVLSATPADNSYVVMLQVQIASSADEDAFSHILDSFFVLE